MSRREKEKARSLDALARIAYSAGSAPPPPARPSAPSPAPARPRSPAPSPTAPRPRGPAAPSAADAARAKQLAERREKLAEEKALRERRSAELARNANLAWRGSGFTDIPASIRRTGFDRVEPSVSQKIHDVLGDVREKESRQKARDKGRRAAGK